LKKNGFNFFTKSLFVKKSFFHTSPAVLKQEPLASLREEFLISESNRAGNVVDNKT